MPYQIAKIEYSDQQNANLILDFQEYIISERGLVKALYAHFSANWEISSLFSAALLKLAQASRILFNFKYA